MLSWVAVAAVTAVAVAVAARVRAGNSDVETTEPVPTPPEPEPVRRRRRRVWWWMAGLAVVLVAAGGGLAVVLTSRPDGAACLSQPTMAADTADTGVGGAILVPLLRDLPPAGQVIPLGGALTLEHSAEMRHEITVLGVDGLKPNERIQPVHGRRLVSVRVRERNTGQLPIIPQGDDHAWLCDTDGYWYQHDTVMTTLLADTAAAQLDSRLQVEQRVVFQIRAESEPSRVRIAQYVGTGPRTGDWKL
ncbi:hypothetical protein [Actinoplanes utahensis]|uniref:DUF4352 domain-containing protein n=1 Tax=Actinoplanes utahensis TaxID=1869 RepID=A0A0A6X567_ACTUT|nr:hypothetical protein MB27_23510 [Actinoplanes utahensis]